MSIIYWTGCNIIALLFNFGLEYVSIEKKTTYMSEIWISLTMLVSISYNVHNMSKIELIIFALICLCLSFLYSVGIEMTKKKFRTEQEKQDSGQSIWREQLIRLLIAGIVALPEIILFQYIPIGNYRLSVFIYLLIIAFVSLFNYFYDRMKMKSGKSSDNRTFILCYYFLSILCAVSEIDLSQVPMLTTVSWLLLVIYDLASVGTQAHYKNKGIGFSPDNQ